MTRFFDVETARADPQAAEVADQFVRNEEFEEVPVSCLDPKKWKVVFEWTMEVQRRAHHLEGS